MQVMKLRMSDVKKLVQAPYVASVLFLVVVALVVQPLLLGAPIWNFVTSGPLIIMKAAPYFLLAFGAGLVLSTGNVDISTSGTAILSGVLWGVAVNQLRLGHLFMGAVALIAMIVLSVAIGLFNGFSVTARRAPSLIITWAIGTIAFLAAIVLSLLLQEAGQTYAGVNGISFTPLVPVDAWQKWDTGTLPLLVGASVVILCVSFLQLPRQCAAVGANWRSANYNGLQAPRIERAAFVTSSITAMLAGILFAEYNLSGQTTDLLGTELMAIAIAVLGGTVMSGGYFLAYSIGIASIAWALLEHVTTASTIADRYFGDRFPQLAFAVGIILIGLSLGGRLSGDTRSVQVKYEHP